MLNISGRKATQSWRSVVREPANSTKKELQMRVEGKNLLPGSRRPTLSNNELNPYKNTLIVLITSHRNAAVMKQFLQVVAEARAEAEGHIEKIEAMRCTRR